MEQVIQRIYVGLSMKLYEVGEEVNGRVVIEIKNQGTEYEDHVHSEYWVLDEEGELIASIENMPIIVEYLQIAVRDEVEDYEVEMPF